MKSFFSPVAEQERATASAWLLEELSRRPTDDRFGLHDDAAPEDESARAQALAELKALEAERALREAEELALEQARLEREEWERRIAEAYEQGHEEGRREGEIAEGARLRNAVQAAEQALDEMRQGEVRWTGTIEENICALSVAIARQVIGRELKTDVGPVIELVRSALAEFPLDQQMRIRVNPTDLQAIREVSEEGEDGLAAITVNRDARWHPDVALAPGGVVVEGRDRIIDGRVDTALERMYRRLSYTSA